MAIETKEKVIGSSVYKINTLATGKNITFLTRITKVFGESLTTMITSGLTTKEITSDIPDEEKELIVDEQNKAVAAKIEKAVSLLVSNMDKDNVPELIESLVKASQTVRDNQLVNYESDFAGDKIGDLFQVIMFIFFENWGSVFPKGAIKN